MCRRWSGPSGGLYWLWVGVLFSCDGSRRGDLSEKREPIVVGAEFALDSPVPAPAPGNQEYPGVSCVGDACLVGWWSQSTTEPHAARVDAASGVIADAYGINVPDASLVSCTGNVCLLAWSQLSATGDWDVWALRVDGSTGAILDSAPIPIHTGPGDQAAAWVSCCGTQCLVLWGDSASTPPAGYGTRVEAATGAVLDPAGFVVASSVNSADCIGSDWMVTVVGSLGTRVRADGTVLDQPPINIAATGINMQYFSRTSVSCGGGTCVVVWAGRTSIGGPHIYASRFDPATGTLLDPNDILITTSAFTQNPSVSCYGTQCLMVWEDRASNSSGNVYGARLDLSTGAFDSPPIHIYTQCVSDAIVDEEYPVVSCGPTDCLVAWQCQFSEYNIYAGRVGLTTGTVSDPSGIMVSLAPNRESVPSVACDGIGCVAVWLDSRDLPPRTPRTYGVRVDPSSGAVLDAQAVALTPNIADQQDKIACEGSECLMVWEVPGTNGEYVSNTVAAVRIDRSSGLAIDGSPIFLESGVNGFPNVGCSGDKCVVVWATLGTLPMKITRINLTTGAVSDPGGVDFLPGLPLGVSCAGGVCLAASESSVARIDLTTGSVLDPLGIAIPAAPFHGSPAVSCSAATCLIVWSQSLDSGSTWALQGERFDLVTGAFEDPNAIAITTAGPNLHGYAVACEGSDCLVVWAAVNGGNPDLFAARIDNSTGTVLDPNGFALTATPELESSPVLAADGAGHFLLLYSRPDNATERVKARVLELLPLGQPCTDDAQCFVGSCTGGQCGPPPTPDASTDDAPIVDAESVDAGMPDALTPDSAVVDASIFDAQTVDARKADAPAADAPNADAGSPAFNPDGGCGCHVGGAGGGTGSLAFGLALLALALRKNRRTQR